MTPVISPIVVGFDGSGDSRRAAAWAAALAREHPGTALHLVHALTLPAIPFPSSGITVDQLIARHEAEIRDAMERERRELATDGLAVELYLRRWLPVESVLEYAEEHAAGLIVVGQRGVRATRLLLGSVSSAIARAAEVPIVVVRGELRARPPARVLVALDGSEVGARAAAAARRWCPHARFLAVSVRDGRENADETALRRQLDAAGFDRAATELRLLDGPVAESLLAVLEEEREGGPIDLVAAGRRGLSRWTEMLLGAVSEKLVQLAPCPVLLAH